MPRKSNPKLDDAEQSKRFIETAKDVEADDAEALDNALKKIASKPIKDRKERS
jgi:hypothetical protein